MFTVQVTHRLTAPPFHRQIVQRRIFSLFSLTGCAAHTRSRPAGSLLFPRPSPFMRPFPRPFPLCRFGNKRFESAHGHD